MQVANKNNECFIIWSNKIEGRLDPTFYIFSVGTGKDIFSIEKFAKIQGGFAFKSNEYLDKGVPLVRIQNIKDGSVDLYDTIFINEKYKIPLSRFLLDENDILIAMTGATIGKIGKVSTSNLPAFLNQRVGRFVLNKEANINKDYLYYILQFPAFQNQIKKLSLGGAQPNISPNSIEKIKIPVPEIKTQNKIVEIMQSAYDKKADKEKEAESILNSIDDYVLEELEIKITSIKNKNCFYINSKEIEGKRLDPKRYLDIPQTIIKAVKKSKYKTKTLSELIKTSIAGEWGKEPTFENNEDYSLIKVLRNTNFDNQGNLNFDDVAERFIENKKLEKVELKTGDILIEKSGGSPIQPVGRVAIIENLKDRFTFSNFLQCFRLKNECLPEYLFCFLKTLYGLNYMEYLQNQTTGIKNLIMEEYLSIPIPLPSIDTQKQLANEFRDRLENTNQLKSEAKSEVEKAKQEVEKIILGK